jgi:hypothetical protein
MAGSLPSARATRTRSRAVARSSPIRHDNQCAQVTAPWAYQPFSSSNWRMHASIRCVATSTRAASSAIS